MEFHVSLEGRRGVAREIYRQVREAIVTGRLVPGDPLPPSRELAKQLSVSRTTVVAAYDQLNGEGFVTTRVGAGTFVSDTVPTVMDRHDPSVGSLRPRPIWEANSFPGIPIRVEFDFRAGLPDATLFPMQRWRRLLARELRPLGDTGSFYSDPAGYRPLRAAIASHIGVSRSVTATADDVIITNGTQEGLDLVARVLVEPGGQVAIEDPGYDPALQLFRSLDLQVAAVPVDDEGLVVDALPAGTRLVFVTPSHQYPLGITMSLPRRVALLEWAERHDAAIVEDDYNSEFRFGGRPIEPLKALDTTGRVIYLTSFSKTTLPSFRLGFLVVHPSLHEAMRSAKFVTDWYTSLTIQTTMARFIEEGLFARHIRRMRREYEARHELVTETLTTEFADHLRVIPSRVGLHVTGLATRSSATDILSVVIRALEAGVSVQPLSAWPIHTTDPDAAPGIAVGYGAIPTDRIREGLRRLRQSFEPA